MEYPDFSDKGDPVCAQTDPDLFFPDKELPTYREIMHMAKEACGTCPYKNECLEWALKNNEIGIWGGTDEIDRSRMKRNYTPTKAKTWNGRFDLKTRKSY